MGKMVAISDKAFERGTISPRLRFYILRRDKFRCRFCGVGALEEQLHIDHVIPVSAGGETRECNLVAACEACNLSKTAGHLPHSVLREIRSRNTLYELYVFFETCLESAQCTSCGIVGGCHCDGALQPRSQDSPEYEKGFEAFCDKVAEKEILQGDMDGTTQND